MGFNAANFSVIFNTILPKLFRSKYSNADQDELWEYLTDAAHQDGVIFDFDTVRLFMDPWTLQEGYPVVRFARSADGTSGSIAQVSFVCCIE